MHRRNNNLVRTVTFVRGAGFNGKELMEAFYIATELLDYDPNGDEVVKGVYNEYRVKQNPRNITIEKKI